MFRNRREAGRRLAAKLVHLRAEDVVVVGLPRGGVPVATEVARALGAPLDVVLVRKLGAPFQPELAMGAIGEGGVRVVDEEMLRLAAVTDVELATVEARERLELERRAQRYREGRAPVSLAGRTVVVVDDGIATGSTARAACQVVRAMGAGRVVLAVPVAPRDWSDRLATDADELVCLVTPHPFVAIGRFYDDFSPTSDLEVLGCLDRAAATDPPARDHQPRCAVTTVRAGPERLEGDLAVPEGAAGIVVFADGSGSSRRSPRNRYVASMLQDAGLGTLLFDLLTPAEERDRANVFDIALLGRRLAGATRWLGEQPQARPLPIGYFGASTGAAAALWASTEPGVDVSAIVSRGGRPDLAEARLPLVAAPTLLIVGGRDEVVLELNHRALDHLHCEKELAVVPGATHLFEERGALEAVAELARDWMLEHFAHVLK